MLCKIIQVVLDENYYQFCVGMCLFNVSMWLSILNGRLGEQRENRRQTNTLLNCINKIKCFKPSLKHDHSSCRIIIRGRDKWSCYGWHIKWEWHNWHMQMEHIVHIQKHYYWGDGVKRLIPSSRNNRGF